ncbi:MAG TPA: peptidoglycan-binding protein LysM [Thermoanaerobaculia bacterium]|nr:peptidoglycan-binding protein LysM [Thermoanaerobaculia bacterium]
MGLFSFAKNVGRKLGVGDDEPQKAAATPGQPTAQQVQDLHERRRAAALVKVVDQMGFKVDDFSVRVDGDKAVLKGKPGSQEEREKIVLLVGNHEGIGNVDDQMQVARAEAQAQFYTVEKGDTLSKIAKQHYGDANAYMRIFEANRPLLKDPDEIYPGQVLRIPVQATAGAARA